MKSFEGLRSRRQHNISKEDIKAVITVLKGNWLTQGEYVEKFEKSIQSYCNVKYALSSNSATSSLLLAYKALGLGSGDYLWTSSNTFVSSSNSALLLGAKVDFIDINKDTFNMDMKVLENKLKNTKQNKLPKIVTPVHFSGLSCDMKKLYSLSKKYNFKIVEDASHAIGASYKNKKVGSCEYSDAAIFSFHPVKIITTGEGGMFMTNDKDLAEKVHMLRTHGITRRKDLLQKKEEGPWYYEQQDLGYNFRLTDMQSALGLSQMKRLDLFIKKRRLIAKRYFELLKDSPLILPVKKALGDSSWHFFSIRVNKDFYKTNKKDFFSKLHKESVALNIHYIPVNDQPYYQADSSTYEPCFEARSFYEECISLPVYYDLTLKDQKYIVNKIFENLKF